MRNGSRVHMWCRGSICLLVCAAAGRGYAAAVPDKGRVELDSIPEAHFTVSGFVGARVDATEVQRLVEHVAAREGEHTQEP